MTTQLYFPKMHPETNLYVQVHELPQNHCCDERGKQIVFMIAYILYNNIQLLQICVYLYNMYIYICVTYALYIIYILYISVYILITYYIYAIYIIDR